MRGTRLWPMMLEELRKVIPSFLTRVDLADRGGAWSHYLESTRKNLELLAPGSWDDPHPGEQPTRVTLTDWDPDAETKLAAASLYSVSELPDRDLLAYAEGLGSEERARIIAAMIGDRTQPPHKPGRALERPVYRFDIACDSVLSAISAPSHDDPRVQRLSTRLGYLVRGSGRAGGRDRFGAARRCGRHL